MTTPSPSPGRGILAKTCLWLHAVSVGEVNLLAPLLKMIEQQRPEWECVISTTTATGMALAKKKYPKNMVFYCPLDFSWAVNDGHAAHPARRARAGRVGTVAELDSSGETPRREGGRHQRATGREEFSRLSPHPPAGGRAAATDRLAGRSRRNLCRAVSRARRPARDGPRHRLDEIRRAQTDRNNPTTRRLAALAGFAQDDIVLLAGSTQEPEEAMALETFRALSPQWPKLRLVLVPRHPDRFEAVAKLLDSSGIPWQRRTALGGRGAGDGWRERSGQCKRKSASPSAHPQSPIPNRSSPAPLHLAPSPRVLLVDVVGELGAWWGTAQIAFVAGAWAAAAGKT